MAFDLATARPEQPSGFDLSTAQPSGQSSGIPGPRQEPGFLTKFGRTAASTADVLLGDVPAAIAGQITYPVARAFGQTPAEAGALTRQVTEPLTSPFGKAFGVTGSPEYQTEAARRVMNFVGQNVEKGAKWLSQQTGLPESDVSNMIGSLTLAAPKVARAVPEATRAVTTAAGEAYGKIPAVQASREATLQANIARSYENAANIDAAKLAQQYGISVNPVVANPVTANRAKAVVAGTATMDPYFAQQNAPKWTNIIKNELGVEPSTQLTAAAYDRALDAASKPYDAVRNITMKPDDAVLSQISALRNTSPTISGEAAATAMNAMVDRALTMVNQGMSGAEVLQNIRQLRRDANSVYRSQKVGMAPDPARIAQADASMGIANALESLIDANAPSPKVLTEMQGARKRLAQINDFERATDPITNLVDPQVFADMLREGKPLTGVAADLGKIAGVFPSISEVKPGTISPIPTLTRGGVGGVVGAGLGGAAAGPVGAAVGMALGSSAGGAVRPLMARRMGTPEYQAQYAIPTDYRPPVNQLTPATMTPREVPNQLVPYDWSQATYTPPNFVIPETQIPPRATFIGPGSAPALPAPSAEATMNALRAEDARRAAMSRALGQQAEAQQAAAEAAARRPATREVILELDPVTGRLREASQGIKGATPATFRNFGESLQIASDKLTANKPFDLTAAEKVAWERTRVDLAEVAPGFNTLTDKAIAEKMMDRQWVEQAMTKARDKATAFEQLAARAKDERARQTALINRERMMDLADQMEESLRAPRPVSTGGQGPKTRAAKRNQLSGESLNKLME